MKKLIAGNWKMHGDLDAARSLIADIVNTLDANDDVHKMCEFLVCPPYMHIASVRHALVGYPKVAIGAQDCSASENGAHTGEISAEMLRDSSVKYVIVGHSERRADLGEGDALVKAKAQAALAQDIKPIICVGETLAQREAGDALAVVEAQLKGSLPDASQWDEITVAYEPVWAIGTGKVAGLDDIAEMHAHIRGLVGDGVRILYGGSLKPENASEILAVPNVDGGLIGGASLKAESFVGIGRAV
ncbi:MAG: triose-phosphate isomerase [Alphaproteobacteria bacterium]